jgi:hypothetical protein
METPTEQRIRRRSRTYEETLNATGTTLTRSAIHPSVVVASHAATSGVRDMTGHRGPAEPDRFAAPPVDEDTGRA